MKPNQKRSPRPQKKVQFWTRERALAALPYVIPVVKSVRDYTLQKRAHRLRAKRLSEQPGRPTRDVLIAQEVALREAQQAQLCLEEALRELYVLNLKSVDALNGHVLFPIIQSNQMAWLIFELHAETPFQEWRFRDDPNDVRRPISELNEEAVPVKKSKPRRKRKPR